MTAVATSSNLPKSLSDVLITPFNMWTTDTEVCTGSNLVLGTVVGKATAGAVPTTGTAGSNTGNGTCTAVTGGVDVQAGIYTAAAFLAQTNAGLFTIFNPKGKFLGVARVGVAFVSSEINLTLNDGATDFVAGDSFTVTVPAGTGKCAILAPAAIDGTAHVCGVLIDAIDASSVDKNGSVVERGSVVDAAGLVWPAGITTPKKTAAIAELTALGIVSKTTY